MNGYKCKQCAKVLAGRRRKWCSKECWYASERKPEGWVRKTAAALKKRMEDKELHKQCAATMYTTKQAAEIIGLHLVSVFSEQEL